MTPSIQQSEPGTAHSAMGWLVGGPGMTPTIVPHTPGYPPLLGIDGTATRDLDTTSVSLSRGNPVNITSNSVNVLLGEDPGPMDRSKTKQDGFVEFQFVTRLQSRIGW